jgi:hypothetical protein
MLTKVDFADICSQLDNNKMKASIDQAVRAAAESAVKGGLATSISESDSTISTLMNVSQEIQSTASSVFRQTNFLSQRVFCENTGSATFSYIDQTMTTDIITKAITSQTSFNSQMLDIVSKLDAKSVSKAEGYDPVGSLVVIAIVIIIGFLVVTLGGSMVGLSTAKSILGSPYTWLTVMSVLSVAFGTMLAGEAFDFWPHRTIDNLDSTDVQRKAKNDINRTVTIVSCIGLGASVLGIGAITYFSFLRK